MFDVFHAIEHFTCNSSTQQGSTNQYKSGYTLELGLHFLIMQPHRTYPSCGLTAPTWKGFRKAKGSPEPGALGTRPPRLEVK